jgi:hypothetical protein
VLPPPLLTLEVFREPDLSLLPNELERSSCMGDGCKEGGGDVQQRRQQMHRN